MSFGENWGKMEQPVEAIVEAVDQDMENCIGLSMLQLDNLSVWSLVKLPQSTEVIMRKSKLQEGFPETHSYTPVNFRIRVGETSIKVQAYHAFGSSLTEAPSGIRVGEKIAKKLNIGVGDRIELSAW